MKTLAILFLATSSVMYASTSLDPLGVVSAAISAAKHDELANFIRCVDLPAIDSNPKFPRRPQDVVALFKSIPETNVTLRPLHTETENIACVAIHGSIELFIELKRSPAPNGFIYTITSIETIQ